MQGDIGKPASELSEKQREVLNLVVARKSSKEIARILGISKPTVDQRILAARQKYGAANRNELVASYLAGANLYDRMPYDSAYLPSDAEPGKSLLRDENSGPVFSVADVAGFIPSYAATEFPPLTRSLETLDRKFGVFGRLGAIGLLAALIATSLLAMLSMAETLTQLL